MKFPLVRMLPERTSFSFMRWRHANFLVAGFLSIASLVLLATVGLNYGVDFRGGTIIEVEARSGPADIGDVRDTLATLDLGDVQVQEFGSDRHLLIRIGVSEEAEAAAAIQKVQTALTENYEPRRTESVGPSVSTELMQQSVLAVALGAVAIFVYLWLRFEWQFALGAIITTLHDVILTIGLFVVLRLDFDLTSVAAVLTIMGYSLNDTVVVYDRIREMLRKYKVMPLPELIDVSINATVSRTIIVSATTFLATAALFFFGGEVLRGFSLAMLFGVVVGTYSTIFISAPMLILFNLRSSSTGAGAGQVPATTPSTAQPTKG